MTVDELKTHLNIDKDDVAKEKILENIIESSYQLMVDYCRRHLKGEEVSERFACKRNDIFLSECPIEEIISMTSSKNIPITYVSINFEIGEIWLDRALYSGEILTITYKLRNLWNSLLDYAQLLICISMYSAMDKVKDNVDSFSTSGATIKYNHEIIPPEAQKILSNYKLVELF